MSGQHHAPAAFSPGERDPGTHWIGGWISPRAEVDAVKERKSLASVGIRLQFLGYPAHSLVTELFCLYIRRTLLKRKLFHVSNIHQKRKRPNFFLIIHNIVNADSFILCILNIQTAVISKHNLIFRII
jgi:hypothetical protein